VQRRPGVELVVSRLDRVAPATSRAPQRVADRDPSVWDRGGGDRSLLRREAFPRLRDSRDMSEGSDRMWCWLALGGEGQGVLARAWERVVRRWEGVQEECRNGRVWLEDWRACGWRASHCSAGASSIASSPHPWMKILPERRVLPAPRIDADP
jgi:hypothetical protein